ncbi:universal stress protein [Neolewinella persica]|uniref:universal stress protein n=1 Tax=Neolewinella persica TaxID=70998 RepID=UPI00039A8AB7|nr:universal stress protein [Neolewinella persica]
MYKIIVPTDFSSTSADALRYGCYLADVTGYDLEVVHVHDGYDGDEAFVVKKGSARIRARVRERLEKFVSLHADQMTFTGIHADDETLPFIKCREVVGTAIGQVLKLSKREDTALVVMGGVGSGIPSRVTPVFGSVAKGVAMGAECPLLLIPQNSGVPNITHAAIAFDEVNTLVELSDKSKFLRKALAPAMHFTHVAYRDDLSEEMMELELFRKMVKNNFPDYAVDFDLLPEGDVANVLIDYSLEQKVDLLILGRHKRGFLMNLLVRSEIPDIIGSCGIPMLIIPLTE